MECECWFVASYFKPVNASGETRPSTGQTHSQRLNRHHGTLQVLHHTAPHTAMPRKFGPAVKRTTSLHPKIGQRRPRVCPSPLLYPPARSPAHMRPRAGAWRERHNALLHARTSTQRAPLSPPVTPNAALTTRRLPSPDHPAHCWPDSRLRRLRGQAGHRGVCQVQGCPAPAGLLQGRVRVSEGVARCLLYLSVPTLNPHPKLSLAGRFLARDDPPRGRPDPGPARVGPAGAGAGSPPPHHDRQPPGRR